ncbi:MAG: type IV toxin-antitoxin system AbiEi family antitoxin [Actinomycetota bacterium]
MPRSHATTRQIPFSDLPEALIAEGRYWATADELAALSGTTPDSTRRAISRLRHQGRVFSPARGFYVMVPPDYRSWGSVPGEWFVDAMMKHLDRAYYVSFLTAAAMHGAAHQGPQTFQVLVGKYLPDRDVGRLLLRFTTSDRVQEMAVEKRTTQTGYFSLATRETTAVDLVWRFRAGGGISNVVTVLKELGELDGEKLGRLAPMRDRATARRLGWILEQYRSDVDPHWLHVVASPDAGEPVLLTPSAPKRGRVDKRWGVVVNAAVEPDV